MGRLRRRARKPRTLAGSGVRSNMIPPKPPRRVRFQIHLSTAVVMMFVAGGLLGLNMRESGPSNVYVLIGPTKATAVRARVIEYGWPFHASTQVKPLSEENAATEASGMGFTRINALVAFNFGIALAILFSVWFVLEWQIRRRAARKRD